MFNCNGKATNPCGHIYIKLYSPLPRQVEGKMLSHTSHKTSLLCLCRVYHVMGNMFHTQGQNPAVSEQEEQKFSHTFSCSSIETYAFEYAGRWLFEQN